MMKGPGRFRRPGVANDVPSGTTALTTAITFAGTRRATRVPTTACGTCIALNAHLQRPFGCERQAEKVMYTPWRNDLSASVGADVDGSLEGIAEDTARSVPEWSGPAVAGWEMPWRGATCAIDGPMRRQRATSTHSGSGARNARPGTRLWCARDAGPKYAVLAAHAAKDARRKNATNAVLATTSDAGKRRGSRAMAPKAEAYRLACRARMAHLAPVRLVGRPLAAGVLT